MKRDLEGNFKNKTDWNSCFICQIKKDHDDLRSTDEGRKSLAKNLLEFWKLGKLDLEWQNISVLKGDIPDFETTLISNKAKYHHACSTRYNNQKLKRVIARKNDEGKKNKKTTRSSTDVHIFASSLCAICSKQDKKGETLHAAGAFHATKNKVDSSHNEQLTNKWKNMAITVGNDSLLNLLSSGDLVSNEVFYHPSCYKDMCAKCSSIEKSMSSVDEGRKWQNGRAFDKVVNYVFEEEELRPGSIFFVSDLNQMYIQELKSEGIDEVAHTTTFTERLIANIPNLTSNFVKSKKVVLFDNTISELVSDYVSTPDDFFRSLRKLVMPIRKLIFEKENHFAAHFDTSSQINSVPRQLLLLTSSLIDGYSLGDKGFSQESLTCAQLVMSHAKKTVKKNQKSKRNIRRHNKKQETPVMTYSTMKIFATVRSRGIIDNLFRAGLCLSYDRMLEITLSIYEGLRESYFNHNCFFPHILKKGLFTILLKDNLDVNAKSNYIKSHYHGTSISLIQFVSEENPGMEIEEISLSSPVSSKSKKLSPLPAEYVNVKDLYSSAKQKEKRLWAPLASINFGDLSTFPELDIALYEELSWLNSTSPNLLYEEAESFPTGWARHHASFKRGKEYPPGINTISPVLRDKVNTLNMQSHCMLMNISSLKTLNPSQTPVDVSDQPVYALSKELQFRYPNLYSNYVPLLGGLHIEQSLLSIHGKLIEGSGLLEILHQHNFSTIGLSAVVDVNSIKRARYCIQVTICALYQKVKEAASSDRSSLPPYEWLRVKCHKSEMCFFWKLIMDLQINILIFVRSTREGNFELYVEVLRSLIKWYFALDHHNYARWLSVHLFDLMTLETKFPDVHENLRKGHFSFQKSRHEFSKMALDQVHEQNNGVLKSAGGVTNLLNRQDESALIRWETCGPDLARLIAEFEDSMQQEPVGTYNTSFEKHREDSDLFCERFVHDVKTLCTAITFNPFKADKLCKINNFNSSLPEKAFENVMKLTELGEKQFRTFLWDRLVYQKVSICETIKKNNIEIWSMAMQNAEKNVIPSTAILNKMRSACEHRPDLGKVLFSYEIFGIPQSLCTGPVTLYHGSKSDITNRLPTSQTLLSRQCKSALVLEMSPIIRAKCFSLASSITTFSDLAVLLYYEILNLGKNVDRIDLVFDRYFDKSLKEGTRGGRGSGSTYVFEADSLLPPKMTEGFLHVSQNKNMLSEFLAQKIISLHTGPKVLIATYKETILYSPITAIVNTNDVSITECLSEEADPRLVRHMLHCLSSLESFQNVVIPKIDTDVLILCISYLSRHLDLTSEVAVC